MKMKVKHSAGANGEGKRNASAAKAGISRDDFINSLSQLVIEVKQCLRQSVLFFITFPWQWFPPAD
jgi:hypothetical protein